MAEETTKYYKTPHTYIPPPKPCNGHTVLMTSDAIVNGVRHAASVSHKCVKAIPGDKTEHEGKCMCECGIFWAKFLNEEG